METRPSDNWQNKQINDKYFVVGFAVLEVHRVKIKQIKNIGKYLDLARELKKP